MKNDNLYFTKECCEQLIKNNELILFIPRTLEEALACGSYWFFEDSPYVLYSMKEGMNKCNLQKSFDISLKEHFELIYKNRNYFSQLLAQAF